MSYRFAVIGNPIEHSLSPMIHQLFAKQIDKQLTYEKINGDDECFEQQVADFFTQGGQGLNVTLPFKQRAFAMSDNRTARCEQAGAANTLWMKDNQLHADNTDGIGFIRDVRHFINIEAKRILILGAGGAARGIIFPILQLNPKTLIIANRNLVKAKQLQCEVPQLQCITLNEISGIFDLIINATSLSLFGEFVVLPQDCIAAKPFCYDLSYMQHGVTSFVHYVKNLGCEAVDGLGMLVEQAAEAFYIWHGVMPNTKKVLSFLCDSK